MMKRANADLRKQLQNSPDGIKRIYDLIVKDDNPYSLYYNRDLQNDRFFYDHIIYDVKLMNEIYRKFHGRILADDAFGVPSQRVIVPAGAKAAELADAKKTDEFATTENYCKILVDILLAFGVPVDEFPPILEEAYNIYYR